MSHSPIQIEVLLHHYYATCNWGAERADSQSASDSIEYWVSVGCLKRLDDPTRTTNRNRDYALTEKGMAMVHSWMLVGLPEPAWVDTTGKVIPTNPAEVS